MKFFQQSIDLHQAKDTGMAFTLIFLLLGYFWGMKYSYLIAIILLLINMIWPKIFIPAANIWISLSLLIGTVVSKIVLSIIFFLIVSPIGLMRKLMGKDSLQLNQWKKDQSSLFRERKHNFTSKDVENPY
jgi:hypothetical protein